MRTVAEDTDCNDDLDFSQLVVLALGNDLAYN